VMWPQTKECLGATTGKQLFFSRASGGSVPLYFIRKKFVVLSHLICGYLLQQPQVINTRSTDLFLIFGILWHHFNILFLLCIKYTSFNAY
jgi:hypothetical protein